MQNVGCMDISLSTKFQSRSSNRSRDISRQTLETQIRLKYLNPYNSPKFGEKFTEMET